jgi:hypothetical protein
MPWKTIVSWKRRHSDEQLHVCRILSCDSCTGYEFRRSRMVNLPILRTIHRHFGSRLSEHKDTLTKFEDRPAYVDGLVKGHPPLSSGLCLAIDAISCSCTFPNASDDSDVFSVNL